MNRRDFAEIRRFRVAIAPGVVARISVRVVAPVPEGTLRRWVEESVVSAANRIAKLHRLREEEILALERQLRPRRRTRRP